MYIQMISIHGLIRGENIEMGRDADTGGQVRYVLELAKQLCQHPEVEQVDIFTRRIRDPKLSKDYGQDIEVLAPNCRLVRLPCGGGRYMRKEKIWPYLDEYADNLITFTQRQGRHPDIVHGHYADAGYVAKEVSAAFDVPFVFTGHSLGKPKLEYLLSEGWSREKADQELNINRRIHVEQDCISAADLVITSTRHERDEQYAEYSRRPELKFEVLPPGTDLDRFFPYYDYQMPGAVIAEPFKQARSRLWNELRRFYSNPDKPLILSLCRPDRRKNIGALIKAYGESPQLQAIANLAVFAGIRQDIDSLPDNEKQVLTDMLLMMDRYDLYGKMAVPKQHDSEFEVPELYRMAAETGGVFVNSAFIELFGLTFIEASATGLPFVGTREGGPQDIVENCKSGIIIDVTDEAQLIKAMEQLLTDRQLWQQCSNDGARLVREFYSWQRHSDTYVACLNELLNDPEIAPHSRANSQKMETPPALHTGEAPGQRLSLVQSMLISDIDNTLYGDDESLRDLLSMMSDHAGRVGFGVATGRSLEKIKTFLAEAEIETADVVIAACGSEIYYGRDLIADRGWASRLKNKWEPDRVREAIADLDYLKMQEEPDTQREFKISYYSIDTGDAERDRVEHEIRERLDAAGLAYSLIVSHGNLVDILPHRASKGKAIRYLSEKWRFPLRQIVTAGDSYNDRDMLLGKTKGIVVANHSPELEELRSQADNHLYFAQRTYASGVLEGLQHYGILPISSESDKRDAVMT